MIKHGLDWIGKTWTGLIKHGLIRHGLTKHRLISVALSPLWCVFFKVKNACFGLNGYSIWLGCSGARSLTYPSVWESLRVSFINQCFVNPCFINPCFLNPCFLNPYFLNPCFINPCFINPVHVLPIHVLSYAHFWSCLFICNTVTCIMTYGMWPVKTRYLPVVHVHSTG